MNGVNDDNQNMPKTRITVSLETELVEWLDKLVEETYEYRDRSHTIEVALSRLRKHIQAEEK
jgi:Arc/MetJ-type ribon-helix-helix transcriptional regulator